MKKPKVSSLSILLIVIVLMILFKNNSKNESANLSNKNHDTYYQQARVVRVIDGDTAVFKIDGEDKKVRFTGINTPEYNKSANIVEHYGKEASEYTKKVLKDKTVYLEKDVSEKDKYGRLLRYVWLEGADNPLNPSKEELGEKLLNGKLVKEGYAYSGNYKPDVKYKEVFDEFQEEANEAKRGMWQ